MWKNKSQWNSGMGHSCFSRRRSWKYFLRKALKTFFFTAIVVIIMSKNIDFMLWVRSVIWFSPEIPENFKRLPLHSLAEEYKKEATIFQDRTEAEALYDKVKILCIVPTIQHHINSGRIQIVNATWGHRCNKILYALCPDKPHPSYINTCMFKESKKHLVSKVTYSLFQVYKYYIGHYDWIFKADDDTYVVVENLRFLLSSYRSDEPGYIGHHFRAHLNQGYNSGGAGFAISRKGLEQVIEQGYEKGLCAVTGEVEDLEIGRCLEKANVPVLSSMDRFDRQTFHTEDFFHHITGSFPAWLVRYAREDMAGGTECCSQFVVSFHHLDVYSLVVLHQLLYRTSVYGIRTPEKLPSIFPARKSRPLNRFVVP